MCNDKLVVWESTWGASRASRTWRTSQRPQVLRTFGGTSLEHQEHGEHREHQEHGEHGEHQEPRSVRRSCERSVALGGLKDNSINQYINHS